MIRSFVRTLTALNLFLLPLMVSAQKKEKPGILWRISGNGLAKPSYLFGTMHLKDKQLFNFPDSLYAAIEQTEGFAMELHPDSLIRNVLNKEDESRLLKDALKPEHFNRIRKKLEAEFGEKPEKITVTALERFCTSRYVRISAENSMNTFMDTYLYGAAARSGKWTGGIEDVEDQLNGKERQAPESTVAEFMTTEKEIRNRLDSMIRIYLAGNIEFMAMVSSGDPAMKRRNHKMAHRMDSLMKVRTMFFAVGAAHLAGKEGVVELLRKKGFTLEAVPFSKREFILDHHFNFKEIPWVTIKDNQGLYTAMMPGEPSKEMNIPGTDGSMKMYIDLQTGRSYFTFASLARKDLTLDSGGVSLARRFDKHAEVKSITTIRKNGIEGRQIYSESPVMYMTLQVFLADGYCYVAILGYSPTAIVLENDISKFFDAFDIRKPTAEMLASRKAREFVSEEGGFKVQLPAKPTVERDAEGSTPSWQYTALDIQNQVGYMVIVNRLEDNLSYHDDSAQLENYVATQKVREDARMMEIRNDTILGYPAKWVNFKAVVEGDSLVYHSLNIVRGRRNYFFFSYAADEASLKEHSVDFFNSISFIYPQSQGWQLRPVPGENFSVYAPAGIYKSADSLDHGTDLKWLSVDTLSAAGIILIKSPMNVFQKIESDTAFLRTAVMQYVGDQQEVLGFRFKKNGEYSAVEATTKALKGHTHRKMLCVLGNEAISYLFVVGEEKALEQPGILKMMEDFRPGDKADLSNLYAPKLDTILKAMRSADSTLANEAYIALRESTFETSDLPLLYDAFRKNDYRDDLFRVHRLIGNAIVAIGDSSSVDVMKEMYRQLIPGNDTARAEILTTLASWSTPETQKLSVELAKDHLPSKGYIASFISRFFDSTELAMPHFHEIMPLMKDSNLANPLLYQANRLLGEKLIKPADLIPYRSILLEYAKRVEKAKIDDENNTVWYYDDLTNLLAALRDPVATAALKRMMLNASVVVKLEVVKSLLALNQPLPTADVLKIAADKGTRLGLYDTLMNAKKLALFPKQYLNQRSLGESILYIYATEDDASVKSILLAGERTVEFRKKKQKFLLYKIVCGDDEPYTYLGVCGPYSLTPNAKLKTYAEVDTIFFDEEYDAAKVDTVLQKYLRELEAQESE